MVACITRANKCFYKAPLTKPGYAPRRHGAAGSLPFRHQLHKMPTASTYDVQGRILYWQLQTQEPSSLTFALLTIFLVAARRQASSSPPCGPRCSPHRGRLFVPLAFTANGTTRRCERIWRHVCPLRGPRRAPKCSFAPSAYRPTEAPDAASASGGTSAPCADLGAHRSALGSAAGQSHSPDALSLTYCANLSDKNGAAAALCRVHSLASLGEPARRHWANSRGMG